MQISQEQLQDVIVVAPKGRIDSTTSAALESHLWQVAKPGPPRLVIDFSEVDYISSAGLRVMLALAKRVRDGRGALALCSLGDSVRQVFELAGFLPLFSIAGSRDAAVRSVTAQ
jgi:anti-anti-sigma factor